MLVLFETPAGFALFKVLDEAKLENVEDLWKHFETPDVARKVVKLKAFSKFENTTEALGAATFLVKSKLSKGLRKFLKEQCEGETLAIADSKLGKIISDKLEINCIHNNAVMELIRGVRSQLGELIMGLAGQDMAPMSLGLSHSLSRYTLKFSPDKVDTMIVQAIGLLDDLDKELNTYAMRVREWYGWHFPELGKIIQDNIQYAKAVKLMGNRTNGSNLDFSGILAEEVESELKEAVVISMGTEVSDQDMVNIKALCDQVIALSEYRAQLFDYLRSRMNAIAPNLTVLVGELVGARLIAHAGSLINLAKHPASTVQILGAEKALFRALKTKSQTPKYGIIYHASLIGQAPPKLKGKISRVLAAKSALSIRCDALGETSNITIGVENRAKVEARLRQLEGRTLSKISGAAKGKAKLEAYDKDRKRGTPALLTAAKTYNPAADSTLEAPRPKDTLEQLPVKKKRHHEEVVDDKPVKVEEALEEPAKEKKKKKKKKRDSESIVEKELNITDDERENSVLPAERAKSAEDIIMKKKKSKKEVLVSAVKTEVIEEPLSKKTKSKGLSEHHIQQLKLEDLGSNGQQNVDDAVKKSKKRKETHLGVSSVDDVTVVEEKKKKKHKIAES
ncbi:hypothetical protein O6H91_01G032300 [Diphasiastrum complanatum]|uniref:Uncharacterized protein n=1 Tax=Diphasiastrum complanatum TaxID=34168 RepID=A0ACC2EPK1_DIPCM|nr:hypothetical protein O6H91_01G032300 [Diphasiastrum complanatum]